MKKITFGEIMDGLEQGLTFEEIAKKCGHSNYKKIGQDLRNEFDVLRESLKKAFENINQTRAAIREKEQHLIENNKGLAGKLGTKIDDFRILDIERNRRINSLEEFLQKREEDHLIDISQWADQKLDKQWEIIQKWREEKNTQNNPQPKTALYYVLELYYKNGCRVVTDTQVLGIGNQAGVSNSKMVSRNKILERENYYFDSTKRNNPQSFKLAYESLIQKFKQEDEAALSRVKKHYEALKETCPTLFD